MKYILLATLAAVCVFIGFVFSRKYRRRAHFYQALLYLCQKFDIEINYSRERLKNIFANLDEKHKNDLQGIEKNFISFLDGTKPLEKATLFEGVNFLKEDEKDLIFTFFKSLGRSDVDSQTKEVKNFQARFESISSTVNNENKKYGSLSIKLGIVAGLLLVVVFI